VAALESKLESYEKEVKQLQKALEKSDKYIAELESKQRDKENGRSGTSSSSSSNSSLKLENGVLKENSISSFSNLTSSSNNVIYNSNSNMNYEAVSSSSHAPAINHTSSNNNQNVPSTNTLTPQSPLKFIRGDNQNFKSDLKIVKFSEKIDTIPLLTSPSHSSMVTSPPSSNTHNSKPQSVISNDKFYGSPSKINSQLSANSSAHVMSFGERMKKNSAHPLFSSSATTTNCYETDSSSGHLNSCSNFQHDHNYSANQPGTNSHQFLFSPLKRFLYISYLAFLIIRKHVNNVFILNKQRLRLDEPNSQPAINDIRTNPFNNPGGNLSDAHSVKIIFLI
jgi:hypothetical protein